MNEFQRWVGFSSFMGVCLAVWLACVMVFHPMPGQPFFGFFAGVMSLIIALCIFEKQESTTVDKQPEKAHNTHSINEEENLNA